MLFISNVPEVAQTLDYCYQRLYAEAIAITPLTCLATAIVQRENLVKIWKFAQEICHYSGESRVFEGGFCSTEEP